MKTLIFSNDLKAGILLLESLVSELKLKEVDGFNKGYSTASLSLKNGDSYKVVKGNDSSRGHRFNKAYVSKDVSEEFVNCCIKPFLFGDFENNLIYF